MLDDRLLVLEGPAEIEGCQPHRGTLVEHDPGAGVFPLFYGLDREHQPRNPTRVLFVHRAVESQLPPQVRPGSFQLVPLVGRQPLSACGSPEEEVHRVSRGEVHDQERDDGDPDQGRNRQQKSLDRVLDHRRIIRLVPEVLQGSGGMNLTESHSSRAAAVS